MLRQPATAWAVVGLCLLQLVALAALVRGQRRLAAGAALLCALAVLTLCLLGMSFDGVAGLLAALKPLEAVFLGLNVGAAVVAAGLLLHGAGRSAGRGHLDAGLWCANTLSCGVMVYLAFFFSLF